MIVSAIVAMSKNRVIGKNNDLPWHLPAELKFFKETTTGHPVIMGRNTFESIYERLGKPLSNRVNIILSSSMASTPKGFVLAKNLKQAIDIAEAKGSREAFIIGGARVYSTAIKEAKIDKLYLTVVDANIDGDTFFPEINKDDWKTKPLFSYSADEKNEYSFTIYEYERR